MFRMNTNRWVVNGWWVVARNIPPVVEMGWMIHTGLWRNSSSFNWRLLPAQPTKPPEGYFSPFRPPFIAGVMRKSLLPSAGWYWHWLDLVECAGEIKESSLWTRAAGRSLSQLVKIPFHAQVSALHHSLGSLMSNLEYFLFYKVIVAVIVTVLPHLQWGKIVSNHPLIGQVLPLKRMKEVWNFHKYA